MFCRVRPCDSPFVHHQVERNQRNDPLMSVTDYAVTNPITFGANCPSADRRGLSLPATSRSAAPRESTRCLAQQLIRERLFWRINPEGSKDMIKHKRVTGVFLLVVLSASSGFQSRPSQRPYLQAAKEAAQWIRSVSVRTDQGVAWPADPRDPKTVEHDLYSGTPGVILFLIEMYASTGDKAFLEDARAGANHLLSALSREEGTGLYVGIAGIGFTLQETYKATGEEKYRTGVLQCLKLLRERAVKKGRGVEWSDTTDIISGAAGTGLFLLYAARELKD